MDPKTSTVYYDRRPGGLKKAVINKIFLILPFRKKEVEILFLFSRDQEIRSSHKKNAWLSSRRVSGMTVTSSRPIWMKLRSLFLFERILRKRILGRESKPSCENQ
jgi:hypothetical protein